MKYGYMSVDHLPEGVRSIGDVMVKINGELNHGKTVKRCHDIEGWYEHEVPVKFNALGNEVVGRKTEFERADIEIVLRNE